MSAFFAGNRTLPAAACCLAAVMLAAACSPKPAAPAGGGPSEPVAVRVAALAEEGRPATEEVVGTVRAKLRAAMEAKVSARIEAFLVAPGQVVKAGEAIAQLDGREIQARLDQATALREQAVRDLDRARALLQQKISTQAEFDAAQSRERVSLGALEEARTLLGYAKIAAPFDGVITRKLADVGDMAAPGRPVAEMENPSALRFEADVPESLVGSMKLGDRLAVRVGESAPMEATVAELAPVADPASRTFLAKLDLPAGAGLRSGQFGRVLVPVGQRRAIHAPLSALVVRGQMEAVFVLEKGQARLRLVRAGRREGGEVELLSGVAPGESVVTEGAAQLRDGQPVTLKP